MMDSQDRVMEWPHDEQTALRDNGRTESGDRWEFFQDAVTCGEEALEPKLDPMDPVKPRRSILGQVADCLSMPWKIVDNIPQSCYQQ